jgi:hypothetical protein
MLKSEFVLMHARWLYLGLFILGGGGITAVQAQPVAFACPRAGVVEERGLGKLQYTGPASSDPMVCNRLNYKNESESRLFNFYLLESSSNAAVKAGLSDLFAGRQARVSFDYTSPTRYLSHETWTILRREKISIGGQQLDTVVFDRETLYQTRGAFHGHFVQWLDPKNGLWVKSETNVISGQVNGQPSNYQDHAITLP